MINHNKNLFNHDYPGLRLRYNISQALSTNVSIAIGSKFIISPFLIKYLSSIFFCLCTLHLQAQINATATLDSTNLLIGDQVQLHIQVKHSADIQVNDLEISVLEEAEGFEVNQVSSWDTIGTDFLQKNITIQSFDSGYHFIPPIPVLYTRNGESQKVTTRQLAFSVNTIAQDTLQLAPIKPIEEEPRKLEDYFWLIAGVLAVALLIGVIRYFMKRKDGEPEVIVPEVKLPAHEIALQQLAALKSEQLWQKGEVKTYHSRLTRIIREYLENRYGIQALEMTTLQILDQLANLDFDASWRDRLQEMLQAADLVKFAKAEPTIEFHERMMEYAELFVEETKKVVIVNEAEEI